MVVGATASGKSALALELAARCGGELLCFDSTTVYRDLNIGVGKPTPEERRRVPHHLLDLTEAGCEWSLSDFLPQAARAAAEIQERGRQPILVGGSYLYLRAFLEGYAPPAVAPDLEFRAWADAQPLTALVQQLQRDDPAAAAEVDLANPRRVIRALEVLRGGHSFAQAGRVRQPRTEGWRKVGLAHPDAPWLQQRIERRIRAMMAAGWRQEVQALCQKGLRSWLLALRVIGYPELAAEESPLSPEEQVASIAAATWRLAKKQKTWGRSERDVSWFDAAHPQLVELAWDHLTGGDPAKQTYEG